MEQSISAGFLFALSLNESRLVYLFVSGIERFNRYVCAFDVCIEALTF